MPLWAVGLTVAFARESLDLSAPRQRLLFRVGVGTVGLFVVVNEAERRLLGDRRHAGPSRNALPVGTLGRRPDPD